MTDYTELKRLAESLIELNRANLMDWAATIEDARIGKTHTEYALAANPAAVLALIAENDRLSASPERQIIRAAVTEAVKGIAEAATADAKAGTLKEIEQLKAECEALRKDADRYRWLQQWYIEGRKRSEIHPDGHICFTTPAIMDTAIDAALGKGEQS